MYAVQCTVYCIWSKVCRSKFVCVENLKSIWTMHCALTTCCDWSMHWPYALLGPCIDHIYSESMHWPYALLGPCIDHIYSESMHWPHAVSKHWQHAVIDTCIDHLLCWVPIIIRVYLYQHVTWWVMCCSRSMPWQRANITHMLFHIFTCLQIYCTVYITTF